MGREPGKSNRAGSLGLIFGLVYLMKLVLAGDDADVLYSADEFKRQIPTKPHLVMFFAPWCGHCKRLTPVYETLAEKFNGELKRERVVIAKVDCTVETALCSDNDVTGYPTLLFYWSDPNVYVKFKGKRDLLSLELFVEKMLLDGPPKEEPKKTPSATTKETMYELTDANFASHIAVGHHFVKFFAPWCGHCRQLAPTWDELAKLFEDDDSVTIAKVDCTKFGNICSEQSVRGYPTLLFFSEGKQVTKYQGARDLNALREFVQKTKSSQDNLGANEFVPDQKLQTDKVRDDKETALELTDATFDSHISTGHHFIKFFAPWCGHCKNLAPTWDELAKAFQDDNSVTIAKVDCTKFGSLCNQYSVRGYPSLLFFSKGKQVAKHQGARTLHDLKAFVEQSKAAQEDVKVAEDIPDEKKEAKEMEAAAVLTLNENSFEAQLEKGHTFVKFFQQGCKSCESLEPVWLDLGKKVQLERDVVVAEVDCSVEDQLCRRNRIDSFPTLILYFKGDRLAEYKGPLDLNSLHAFILQGMMNPQSLLSSRDEL